MFIVDYTKPHLKLSELGQASVCIYAHSLITVNSGNGNHSLSL